MTIHDMVKMELNDEKKIYSSDAGSLWIIRVPGGWIYVEREYGESYELLSKNSTFVPIPKTMGEIV